MFCFTKARPHNGWERDLLRRELETKSHVELRVYSFYKERLRLRPGDAKRVTRLFTDGGSFMPYGGPKTCGGYHPDYGIEWRAKGEVYRGFVCFSCGEVKIYGPTSAVHCDIKHSAYKEFEKLLRPYRVNRPKSRRNSGRKPNVRPGYNEP